MEDRTGCLMEDRTNDAAGRIPQNNCVPRAKPAIKA